MTLVDYISTLRRYWVVIVLLGIVGGLGAYAYSRTLPNVYASQSSVMVIPARGDTTGELVQGSNYVQNLVQTYTIVATSPLVLSRVIDDLGLAEEPHQLAQRIDVSAPLNTVIINMSVTDRTPQDAQRIANALATELSQVVAELSPQGADGSPAVRIEVIAPARLPLAPIAPNTRNYAALGVVAGLGFGVAFALVRRLLGTRLTSVNDVREVTEAPLLGEIATIDERGSVPAMIRATPSSRVAESLRGVVAALRFVDVEARKRVLLITSSLASEGKTSVSLGISIMLAEVGHRVLYIEADLRRPKAGHYTHLEGAVGLTTVMVGDHSLEDAVQEWGHPNLHVLMSGALPPNPAQLLASDRLREVIAIARESYDYVIVDSAPVLPVADAMWLTSVVDGALLIVRLNQTTRQAFRQSLGSIDGSLAPLIGIVVNDVKSDPKSGYYGPEQAESNRRTSTRRWPRRPASSTSTR